MNMNFPYLDYSIPLGPSYDFMHHLYTLEYATTNSTLPWNLHLNWVT